MKPQEKKLPVPNRIVLHLIFVGIMLFAAVWGLFMFSEENTSNPFFQKTNLIL